MEKYSSYSPIGEKLRGCLIAHLEASQQADFLGDEEVEDGDTLSCSCSRFLGGITEERMSVQALTNCACARDPLEVLTEDEDDESVRFRLLSQEEPSLYENQSTAARGNEGKVRHVVVPPRRQPSPGLGLLDGYHWLVDEGECVHVQRMGMKKPSHQRPSVSASRRRRRGG